MLGLGVSVQARVIGRVGFWLGLGLGLWLG